MFLPEESHGQRSLVGYSPWSREKSDTTEQLTLSLGFKDVIFVVVVEELVSVQVFEGIQSNSVLLLRITYLKGIK